MKYFFFLILTDCAETLKTSAQSAKDENFHSLNDIQLTAPCGNGVDLVLTEIYDFFRTVQRSILRRDGIFRFHYRSFPFSAIRSPSNSVSIHPAIFNSIKGRTFYEKV